MEQKQEQQKNQEEVSDLQTQNELAFDVKAQINDLNIDNNLQKQLTQIINLLFDSQEIFMKGIEKHSQKNEEVEAKMQDYQNTVTVYIDFFISQIKELNTLQKKETDFEDIIENTDKIQENLKKSQLNIVKDNFNHESPQKSKQNQENSQEFTKNNENQQEIQQIQENKLENQENIQEKNEQKQEIIEKNQILQQNNQYLNLEALEIIYEIIEIQLQEFLKVLKEKFLDAKKVKKEDRVSSVYNDLKIINSRLITIYESLPFAIYTKSDDLFCGGEQSKIRLQKLQESIIIHKDLNTPEKLKKHLQKLTDKFMIANAMVSKGKERKSKFGQMVQQYVSASYYALNTKQSNRKADIFLSDPDQDQAFFVWNLLEQGFLKQAAKIGIPSIEFKKKIYVDSYYKDSEITIENQMKQIAGGTINKIDNFEKINDNSKDNQELDLKKLYKEPKNIHETDQVQIRILNHKKLKYKKENTKKEDMEKNFDYDYESIIIQIHGGGFVAMSSGSHQNYTRQWANEIKVPVFCIDYKLAPKFPYPAGLNDCWNAYNWIINYSNKVFNVNPKNVVLVGDSAGGNLIATLTGKCIKNRVKIPTGLMLIYPALNLSLDRFTPSHLKSLDDRILSHKVLKLCARAYLTDQNTNKYIIPPLEDPFVSASEFSDEILKEFPPTRIVVGKEDAFHDDCWRFAERLTNLGNKDVHMTVYNGMPHGFMNFDVPQGLKEAKQCTQDTITYLKQLLKLN